jgi:hypothetical protein
MDGERRNSSTRYNPVPRSRHGCRFFLQLKKIDGIAGMAGVFPYPHPITCTGLCHNTSGYPKDTPAGSHLDSVPIVDYHNKRINRTVQK